MTFHLGKGNEHPQWEQYADYHAHQKRELLKILSELEKHCGPFDQNSPLYPYLIDLSEGKSLMEAFGWNAER